MNNTKSNTRKQYTPAFKAQVMLEALKEVKTVAQIASEHQFQPKTITSRLIEIGNKIRPLTKRRA